MQTHTKKVQVNGQELTMSSLDGRTWFLKPESMYDFDKRMRQVAKTDDEFEVLEVDDEDLELV